MYVLLKMGIFHCYVSLPESIWTWHWFPYFLPGFSDLFFVGCSAQEFLPARLVANHGPQQLGMAETGCAWLYLGSGPPHPGCNRHHQVYYIFSRGSGTKPLFATVTGLGVHLIDLSYTVPRLLLSRFMRMGTGVAHGILTNAHVFCWGKCYFGLIHHKIERNTKNVCIGQWMVTVRI